MTLYLYLLLAFFFSVLYQLMEELEEAKEMETADDEDEAARL